MDRTRPIDSVPFAVGFCDLDRSSIFLSREPTSRRGQPCTALHPQGSWRQWLLFLGHQLRSASLRFDFHAAPLSASEAGESHDKCQMTDDKPLGILNFDA